MCPGSLGVSAVKAERNHQERDGQNECDGNGKHDDLLRARVSSGFIMEFAPVKLNGGIIKKCRSFVAASSRTVKGLKNKPGSASSLRHRTSML